MRSDSLIGGETETEHMKTIQNSNYLWIDFLKVPILINIPLISRLLIFDHCLFVYVQHYTI